MNSNSINDYLLALEKSPNFINNNIKVTHKIDDITKSLTILLNNGEGGSIEINLNGKHFIDDLVIPVKQYADDVSTKYTEDPNFFAHVNENNLAHFDTIKINSLYQGKKLTYPLMCTTFNILKNIYKKEYVGLQDVSNIPNYYEKLGFKQIFDVIDTLKYNHIDNIIMKCDAMAITTNQSGGKHSYKYKYMKYKYKYLQL